MKLHLKIAPQDGFALPAGSAVNVEIRDTSLADAPAVLLQKAHTQVPASGLELAVEIELKVASVPGGTTVWVHVDVDGDGRVSVGDFITQQSYPIDDQPSQRLDITVRKVE